MSMRRPPEGNTGRVAVAVTPGMHVPIKPLWICRVDAQPWPCADARLILTEAYRRNPVEVGTYLGASLHEMVADLYRLNPATAPDAAALYVRLLGWLPPRHLDLPAPMT